MAEPGHHHEPSDRVLRALSGDEQALDELLGQNREPLMARIRRRLHRGLAAKLGPEDVLGDVYLVVSEQLADFRGDTEPEFTAWLVRIADFKVKEKNRYYLDTGRRDMRMERPPGTRPNDSRIPGLGATPSQEAMRAELVLRAERAFRKLPPDYQTVLQLMRVEGADLHAVAEQMGRSYEATKKLHARALELYRRHLAEG